MNSLVKNISLSSFLITSIVCYSAHETALYKAIQENNIETIHSLIDKINVNFQDQNGRTPLHYAAAHGNLEAVQLLIKKGANINCRDKDGKTPLHYTVLATKNNIALATLLYRHSACLNVQDNEWRTPLHYAALLDKNALIEWLIHHGAALQIGDKYGHLPTQLRSESNIQAKILFTQALKNNSLRWYLFSGGGRRWGKSVLLTESGYAYK